MWLHLYLQGDGNLVFKDVNGNPYGSTGTSNIGVAPYQLIMQTTGQSCRLHNYIVLATTYYCDFSCALTAWKSVPACNDTNSCLILARSPCTAFFTTGIANILDSTGAIIWDSSKAGGGGGGGGGAGGGGGGGGGAAGM
jgi:hypothetical protein